MRILSLAISFLVTVSLAGVALTYLEHRVGQNRIKVPDEWVSSPEEKAYHTYGYVASPNSDTTRADSLPIGP